jgi:hypothetical protein
MPAHMFCRTPQSTAVGQEYTDAPAVSPAIDDLRHWWLFRQNARSDAVFSVSFLQMLSGHQPNWSMPDAFRARLSAELAPTR